MNKSTLKFQMYCSLRRTKAFWGIHQRRSKVECQGIPETTNTNYYNRVFTTSQRINRLQQAGTKRGGNTSHRGAS